MPENTIDPEKMSVESLRALCRDLLEEVEEREEHWKEELQLAISRERVRAARDYEREVYDRYSYDVTGQDGEEEISAAIQARFDAEDADLKRRDPERWAEQRYFYGC